MDRINGPDLHCMVTLLSIAVQLLFHSFVVKEVLDYFSLSSYLMIISGDLSSHSEPHSLRLFAEKKKKSLSGNF